MSKCVPEIKIATQKVWLFINFSAREAFYGGFGV
jgi:hypothetical protein